MNKNQDCSGRSLLGSLKALTLLAIVALAVWTFIAYGRGTVEPMEENPGVSEVPGGGATSLVGPAETEPDYSQPQNDTGVRGPVAATPGESEPSTVRVTIVGPTDGAPVPGVAWYVIRTGPMDRGLLHSLGGQAPNPKPIHSGVTGVDGVASFEPDSDELLHMFSERTSEFARASWPIQVQKTGNTALRVSLLMGSTVMGRVVNDRGRPIPGVVLQTRTYGDSPEEVAVTDGQGEFSVKRVADFPRAYVMDEVLGVQASRTDSTELSFFLASKHPGDSSSLTWVAGRSVQAGLDPHIRLDDVVLNRGQTIVGRVVHGDGSPAMGALVSTQYVRHVRANGDGQYQELEPLPWQEGGELLPGECLANGAGEFKLQLEHGAHTRRRLTAVSRKGGAVTTSFPKIEPGETSEPILVEIPIAHSLKLNLVDAEDPSIPIWHCEPSKPKLILWPLSSGEESHGLGSLELFVPKSGVVELNRQMLGAPQRSVIVMLSGYFSKQVELDLSKSEQTVALERRPTLAVKVQLLGPGAEAAESLRMMVSALAPKPVSEEQYKRSLIWSFDEAPHLESVYGIAAGAITLFPRPNADEVWVYVEMNAPSNHKEGPSFTFGPFGRDVLETTCKIEAPAWIQHEPRGLEGIVLLEVVSADTGEPVVGALDSRRREGGSYMAHARNGAVRFRAFDDSITPVLTHPMYRDLHMGEIQVTPGGTVNLGQVSMERLIPVRGQLITSNGTPLRERRSIRFKDRELGMRTSRSKRDGSFVLAVSEGAPLTIGVDGPGGYTGLPQELPLEQVSQRAKPESPEGPEWTCEVPNWVKVTVLVSGLDLDLSGTWTSLLLEDGDGRQVKIWQSGVRQGETIYTGLVPPGHYVLSSGPLVAVPSQAFEVVGEAHVEGLEVKTRGHSGIQ